MRARVLELRVSWVPVADAGFAVVLGDEAVSNNRSFPSEVEVCSAALLSLPPIAHSLNTTVMPGLPLFSEFLRSYAQKIRSTVLSKSTAIDDKNDSFGDAKLGRDRKHLKLEGPEAYDHRISYYGREPTLYRIVSEIQAKRTVQIYMKDRLR